MQQRERQQRGPAVLLLAQVFDHIARVLRRGRDDVLQRAAERHGHGRFKARRHMDQLRHHAGDGGAEAAVARRVGHEAAHARLIALARARHLAEHAQTRARGLRLLLERAAGVLRLAVLFVELRAALLRLVQALLRLLARGGQGGQGVLRLVKFLFERAVRRRALRLLGAQLIHAGGDGRGHRVKAGQAAARVGQAVHPVLLVPGGDVRVILLGRGA